MVRPVSGLSDIWISSDTRPFSHYLTLPDSVRRLSVSTRNEVLAGKRISGSPVAHVLSLIGHLDEFIIHWIWPITYFPALHIHG